MMLRDAKPPELGVYPLAIFGNERVRHYLQCRRDRLSIVRTSRGRNEESAEQEDGGVAHDPLYARKDGRQMSYDALGEQITSLALARSALHGLPLLPHGPARLNLADVLHGIGTRQSVRPMSTSTLPILLPV